MMHVSMWPNLAVPRARRYLHAEFHERTHERHLELVGLALEVGVGNVQLLTHHGARLLGLQYAVRLELTHQRRHVDLQQQIATIEI